MTFRRKEHVRKPVNDYATVDDFRGLFAESMDELYQLSFLLTADHDKAEQCFVAGLEDSGKENHVFKEWARSWAKRVIVQNAIRELKPRPLNSSFSLAHPAHVFPLASDQGRHFEVEQVLALGDFERFVFVMSVLESYSEHECSLLLSCSPLDIRQARARAIANLMNQLRPPLPNRPDFETVQELVR
jgi:hypothetical protein